MARLAGFKVEEKRSSHNDALIRPVTLLETLRDLPLYSVAHVFVAVLLHTRQQQQSHQKQSCSHQDNRRHTAVALQTLRNHTTASISQLGVSLHHTPSHAPPLPRLSHNRTSRLQPQRHSPGPISHTPPLTKLIVFRRLNRPRLAHSGAMSSSISCCSERCEEHVSGGRRGCGEQAGVPGGIERHEAS
jgi:hypothetical protein